MKGVLGLFLLLCLVPVRAREYPLSDHYDGKKFFNPGMNHLHTLWDVIKWKMTSSPPAWPMGLSNKDFPPPKFQNERALLTFINHATFLIQTPDLNFLTDPIFSERASPINVLGPKRIRPPGLSLEKLPKIDVVIISHNHYDHLNLDSLKELERLFHPLFLVPLGDGPLLSGAGIKNVREMDWWEVEKIKNITITFTPAQHWSARTLFDQCESLWGSYFIDTGLLKIYFGGDTGLGPHFKTIAQRLGNPDVSMLPIGAYAPRYFMQVNHMDPEEAYAAHLHLNSRLSIGMHFGTFQLTDEPFNEPEQRLLKVSKGDFIILEQGESRSF